MFAHQQSLCPECQGRGSHLNTCTSHPERRPEVASFEGQGSLRHQLEELFETVRRAEADWRFADRLALAARIEGWDGRPARGVRR